MDCENNTTLCKSFLYNELNWEERMLYLNRLNSTLPKLLGENVRL